MKKIIAFFVTTLFLSFVGYKVFDRINPNNQGNRAKPAPKQPLS